MPANGRSSRRGRPPGPTRDHQVRRAELLDAATVAIREHGPDASMAEIAQAAGITKPILYRHFGDKAGLGGALAERAVAELTSSLAERAVAELTASLAERLGADLPPRDRMRETIGAFLAFADDDEALYRFLVRGATKEGGGQLIDGIAGQIAVVLSAALRQVGADSGPAELWAHAIIGAVFSGGQWWSTRRVVGRDQLTEDLTRLLWDGLGSTGLDRASPG